MFSEFSNMNSGLPSAKTSVLFLIAICVKINGSLTNKLDQKSQGNGTVVILNGRQECVPQSTTAERQSIMQRLLENYDKAAFPADNVVDVQAEVSIEIFFLSC